MLDKEANKYCSDVQGHLLGFARASSWSCAPMNLTVPLRQCLFIEHPTLPNRPPIWVHRFKYCELFAVQCAVSELLSMWPSILHPVGTWHTACAKTVPKRRLKLASKQRSKSKAAWFAERRESGSSYPPTAARSMVSRGNRPPPPPTSPKPSDRVCNMERLKAGVQGMVWHYKPRWTRTEATNCGNPQETP